MSECREQEPRTIQPPDAEPSRQLSLRWMLVAMAVIGAMLGGALRVHAPALFINCIVASLAVLVWKVARPSLAGLICGTLGLQAAVLAGVVYYGDDGLFFGDFVCDILLYFAAALIVVGLLLFARGCNPGVPARRQNRITAIGLMAIAIGGVVFAPPVLSTYRQAWIDAQNRENAAHMQTAIDEVEALCTRLGKTPLDEGELTRLLGHPLPGITRYGSELKIRYRRIAPGQFQLEYFDWDIYTYDSANPSAGWVRTRF